jgi:hypothetical protein
MHKFLLPRKPGGDQDEAMDFLDENDPKTSTHQQRWISKLPLLHRRRPKEQRRGPATKGKEKSHPANRGASSSTSTLETEATSVSSSSLLASQRFSAIDESRPQSHLHDHAVGSDNKEDGVSLFGMEYQEETRAVTRRGLSALKSSRRKNATIKTSRRTRLGMELPTKRDRSLQKAVEEIFDDLCSWCMNLRAACAVYLRSLALDSDYRTSVHAAVVGCVLGCVLLAFRDATVLTLCFLATCRIMGVVGMWTSYFTEHRIHRDAVKSMRGMLRRLLRESERAINGDYSRQVLAGYLLYNCTAPGESYVASCIRYRMSVINRSVIQEMEERQLKRLGYQKSERDLFQ